MDELELRWYLFGAQAAILWGAPRFSADVDVTVTIPPSDLDPFIAAMAEHGFDLRFADREFIESSHVLLFTHRNTRMPLDVVLAGSGLEADFMDRAIVVDIGTIPVPVITAEDLIIAKVFAGRPKDVEDVRGVIAERKSKLDVERIRQILGFLEQALSQSDLLPLFERLWSAA